MVRRKYVPIFRVNMLLLKKILELTRMLSLTLLYKHYFRDRHKVRFI